jgi:GDPmannose 4,6-dehydratase
VILDLQCYNITYYFDIAHDCIFSEQYFVECAYQHIGFDISWQGKEENGVGIDKKTGREIIKINPEFYRLTEVDLLLGDATKAKQKLGWKPKTTFEGLVEMMAKADTK